VKPSREDFVSATSGYVDQLYRLVYSHVLNRQDAEDIVQETYLKAYRSYETFSNEMSVSNWMTRILINTVRDHFRKNRRCVPIVDVDGAGLIEERPAGTAISPEDQLCNMEIDPSLLAALQLIPEPYLVPLLLREIHDASYDEIASVLDVPKGTVMSRLSRGRALLRKGFFSGADGHQSIEDNGNPKNGSRGSF
jgi:RNA polymerase sigma-70 factor (ECF subfamily)